MPPPPADDPFVDAIFAAPDDDAPRLVYADHLLEHGDALHGELIVVQCTRERLERDDLSTTPEYRATCAREREILAVFGAAWTRTFGLRSFRGEWARGFLTNVTGLGVSGLRGRWHLLSRHPLTSTDVSDGRRYELYPSLDDLRWIATEARALRLMRVTGNQGGFDLDARADMGKDDAVTWVWGAPLPHERLLPSINGIRVNQRGESITALASATLPRLRRFMLSTNSSSELTSIEPFVGSPTFAALEHVACWSIMQSDALLVLQRAPVGLRTLTVESDYSVLFDPSVARGLGVSPALASVEELRVKVEYDLTLVEEVATRATRLERLTLGAAIAPEALEAFAESAIPARLRHLEMTCRGETKISATPLVRAPFVRLTSLELAGFAIDEDFATSPALETLVQLRFRRCEMTQTVKDAILARWPQAWFT